MYLYVLSTIHFFLSFYFSPYPRLYAFNANPSQLFLQYIFSPLSQGRITFAYDLKIPSLLFRFRTKLVKPNYCPCHSHIASLQQLKLGLVVRWIRYITILCLQTLVALKFVLQYVAGSCSWVLIGIVLNLPAHIFLSPKLITHHFPAFWFPPSVSWCHQRPTFLPPWQRRRRGSSSRFRRYWTYLQAVEWEYYCSGTH